MDGGLLFLCWFTLHRNLQSGWTYQAWKTILKGRLRGTEENKKVLSLFPAWKAHYSSSSPLSEKHPPPLNYFTFFSSRLTSPQAHTVWVTNASFSSTIAPPPFSHWLFYSLIPATAPSFPLSSPLLFLSSFLFIAGCSHRPAHSQRAPLSLSHWSSFKPELSPEKLRHCSKGSYCSSLKVQKRLLSQCFTICICILPFDQWLYLCVSACVCEICESVSV